MKTHAFASVRRFLSSSIPCILCLAGWLLCRNAAQAGVIAHFRFDEEGGAIATNSVGSVHGTLSSTGTGFAPGGVSGNALQLDRALNGYVLVGDQFGFSIGDFTVVAWVKTQPGDTAPDTVVLGKHQAGIENGYVEVGNFFDFQNVDSTMVFWVRTPLGDTTPETVPLSKHEAGFVNGYLFALNNIAGGAAGAPGKVSFFEGSLQARMVSTSNVNDGNWHQVAVVSHVGASRNLYVDGTPLEASRLYSPTVSSWASFVIGGFSQSGQPLGSFTGWIDELRLYQRDHRSAGQGFVLLGWSAHLPNLDHGGQRRQLASGRRRVPRRGGKRVIKDPFSQFRHTASRDGVIPVKQGSSP